MDTSSETKLDSSALEELQGLYREYLDEMKRLQEKQSDILEKFRTTLEKAGEEAIKQKIWNREASSKE